MSFTYLQSLQLGLEAIFAEDERVVLLGEDILHPYGGAFKVSARLSSLFPDRVITTPISEAGIIGIGSGMALRGYVPIIEIMFGDFLTLCADQIVNHAAKFPQMYPNVNCPLIVRTPMGGGRGYGPTHSQSLEKMFLGLPGIKIIAPSHFHAPGKTLRHVVANEKSPTLFIEHKLLYAERLHTGSPELPMSVVSDESGYKISIVRNYQQGELDVCVLAYGGSSRLLHKLLVDLAAEEIRVMAVLPECIDPVPKESLLSIVSEANRVVVVDEGHEGFGWATGIASMIYEERWGKLDAPIRIVSADRVIIPTSPSQEANILVSKERIEEAIMRTVSWA